MMPVVDETRRRRLLAEMGVVRYRLREPRSPVVAVPAGQLPSIDTARRASLDVNPQTSSPGRDQEFALAVNAGGSVTAPSSGVEAVIWRQVLAWLGYASTDVTWRTGDGSIGLPAIQTWSTPEGKRGLWNALKAHVRAAR